VSRVGRLSASDGVELVLGVRIKPLFGDGCQPVREDYRERCAGE